MSKYPITISLTLVALIIGGYFAYQHFVARGISDPWQLVPANTLAVYEKETCPACMDQIASSPVWKLIERASLHQKAQDSLRRFVSRSIAAQQRVLVSLHATKKDDFDFVYYAVVDPGAAETNGVITNSRLPRTKRIFNGHTIFETREGKSAFSWAVIGEVWVGSFTSFLIEDVVRTAIRKEGFLSEIPLTQRIAAVSDDAGNLYLNTGDLAEWLSIFQTGNTFPISPARSSVLDIKVDRGSLVLNGFSADTTDRSKYLVSLFRNQSPVPFSLKNLVSNSAISLSTYGISNGREFFRNLRDFNGRRPRRGADSLKLIAETTGINVSSLLESVGDEIAVCRMESTKGGRVSRVLLIETSDANPWLNAFGKIADRYSADTLFFEHFGRYDIREVPVFRFPEKLLHPLVSGFDQSFYTSSGNVIFVSENLADLKKFLADIEEDETWGRSVTHNKLLESTLLESNISTYANTARLLPAIIPELKPRWQSFVRENINLFWQLQFTAIQFSHLNNAFYANISFSYQSGELLARNTTRSKIVTTFDHGIRSLYAVKSHVSRNDEILVQDSVNDLSLVSDDGTILWKLGIGDRITSDVTQIDFFNNGKLQYFFTTASGIHVIDRLGNYVDPFPVLLSAIDIAHGVVVDYDHSRRYRFLTADTRGKLWLYDKAMNNLEGWQPKDIGGPLAMAPGHHRVKGRDYVVAIRKDGIAYVMNRRGETLKNFPLDLSCKPAGSYYVEEGSGTSDSYVVVVSDDGFKIKFSLEGKIQSREPLIKTSVQSRFRLVAEKRMRSYLVAQQDAHSFSISDESGRRLLSIGSIGDHAVTIAFNDFGSGRSVISVTDTVQGLTYLFDGSGNPLTTMPLESRMLEIRPKDSDENRAFQVRGRSMTIESIDRTL